MCVKTFLKPCLLLTLALLSVSDARAQATAGALYGVQEVVLQAPHFDNPRASAGCSLNKDTIGAAIEKVLKTEHVPVTPVAKALPPRMDIARIELLPVITTLNSDGLDCASWVSLTAQYNHSLVVPPVVAVRDLTVTYWRQGTMVSSPQSAHFAAVGDMLERMTGSFATQFINNQKK